MMIIERCIATSKTRLSAGKHTVEVTTVIKGNKPGVAGTVILLVDGKEVGKAHLKRTVPPLFTASETFDVGVDFGSPVSLNYSDRRPFRLNGTIDSVAVKLH